MANCSHDTSLAHLVVVLKNFFCFLHNTQLHCFQSTLLSPSLTTKVYDDRISRPPHFSCNISKAQFCQTNSIFLQYW